MLSQRLIKEEKQSVAALKTIVDVYGEVASIRMRKIRDSVLKNRSFLTEIEGIFRDCLNEYAKKIAVMVKKGKLKRGGKVTFLAHNGQTVCVLISANTGFYGNVVHETFNKFLEEVRRNNSEVTIIGKLGKTLFLDAEPERPYSYFNLPDYDIDKNALNDAISHLVQYEEIKIFYGRYYSVVTQKPEVYDISAGTPILDTYVVSKERYIFEPNVEKILTFFETQIFASLFDQSLRESQLAKYASRILAMEEAGENIRGELKNLDLQMTKLRHRMNAKKQLNLLPAIMMGK